MIVNYMLSWSAIVHVGIVVSIISIDSVTTYITSISCTSTSSANVASATIIIVAT